MWGSKLIPLITFERQAELWAPSPVIRASICIYQYLCYSLTLRDLVPPLTFRCLYYDARKKKNHWNTIAQLQVWAQTHFHLHPPPHPPPSRSNWTSNLSWCCVQVERRTSSTACSLFRSLSAVHICIDLQLFLSRRDGWQSYQEADPYWSERSTFTRPSFDGGRRSWLK